jgi:hypothetical protein
MRYRIIFGPGSCKWAISVVACTATIGSIESSAFWIGRVRTVRFESSSISSWTIKSPSDRLRNRTLTLASLLIPNTSPEVDDFLTALKSTAPSAQLASPNEVLDERLANALKSAVNVPLNFETL